MGKIRSSKIEDCPFIAEAIISAEKSNSDNLGLSLLFGLDESRVKELIISMLQEEIDGCEFSLSSFLIYEEELEPVATVGGWIEQFDENIGSGLLKSNLINFTFPKENLNLFEINSKVLSDLKIEREPLTLQIEYVYVKEKFRGKRIAEKLINEHIKESKLKFSKLKKVQVQLFKNNFTAFRLYMRIDFNTVEEFHSLNNEILSYLPFNAKLLMEKQL